MAINKSARYISSLHVTMPGFRKNINNLREITRLANPRGTTNPKACSQSAICLDAVFSELLQELYGY